MMTALLLAAIILSVTTIFLLVSLILNTQRIEHLEQQIGSRKFGSGST